MKKIVLFVAFTLTCGIMLADEPMYNCPSGTKPDAPRNSDEYKYSNTTTVRYGNCESKTTQHEGTQNHYGASANGEVSSNPMGSKAGLKGEYSRDGEKTTTTTSTSQCNENTVRYICR